MIRHSQSIHRSLSELDRVAAEWEKYRSVTAQEMEKDLSSRWMVEGGLRASLNLIFHVADHILASAFHQDRLTELCACGVISADLLKPWQGQAAPEHPWSTNPPKPL